MYIVYIVYIVSRYTPQNLHIYIVKEWIEAQRQKRISSATTSVEKYLSSIALQMNFFFRLSTGRTVPI